MNRDGDHLPILPSRDSTWREITVPRQAPRSRRIRQGLVVSQVRKQIPLWRHKLAQLHNPLPGLTNRTVAQARHQLPRLQHLIDEQIDLLPNRIHYLRYAHKQKSGKVMVRGLFSVSGALSLLDLAILDQLWF